MNNILVLLLFVPLVFSIHPVFQRQAGREIEVENAAYNMTDKHQFMNFFQLQWEFMFNKPIPLGDRAKDEILKMVSSPLYFQPCFEVERRTANAFWKGRLWGMRHALVNAEVVEAKILPNEDRNDILNFDFQLQIAYTSYNKRYYTIWMEMHAFKSSADSIYHIGRIKETCQPEV